VYDRSALLFLRNSPLAKTPPNNIAFIPGVTGPEVSPKDKVNQLLDCAPKRCMSDECADIPSSQLLQTKQEKVKQPKENKDDGTPPTHIYALPFKHALLQYDFRSCIQLTHLPARAPADEMFKMD
jgi:hypothetical protein